MSMVGSSDAMDMFVELPFQDRSSVSFWLDDGVFVSIYNVYVKILLIQNLFWAVHAGDDE